MVPTLPFQNFTQQFSANRQLIASIGQQMAQNTQLHHRLAAAQPTQNQQPTAGAQPAAGQAQIPPQNPNPPVIQAQPIDRLGFILGHIWLVLKFVLFVYFFASGGSWYRPIAITLLALVAYLAQVGALEHRLERVRRQFEALLPLADRAAQDANRAANAPGANAGAEPGQDLTPEETARRLLQERQNQRRGWVRETMRSVERAFGLFVASFVPGIGERMVQAQEERRRAEEERQRLLREQQEREEAERAEAEGNAGEEESGKRAVEGEAVVERSEIGGPVSSAKGKEKVDVDGDVVAGEGSSRA